MMVLVVGSVHEGTSFYQNYNLLLIDKYYLRHINAHAKFVEALDMFRVYPIATLSCQKITRTGSCASK